VSLSFLGLPMPQGRGANFFLPLPRRHLPGCWHLARLLQLENSRSAKQEGRVAAQRTSFAKESHNLYSAASFPEWATGCRLQPHVRELQRGLFVLAQDLAQSMNRRDTQKGGCAAWDLPPTSADDSALNWPLQSSRNPAIRKPLQRHFRKRLILRGSARRAGPSRNYIVSARRVRGRY